MYALAVVLLACLALLGEARAADQWSVDCYYNTTFGATAQAAADACMPVLGQHYSPVSYSGLSLAPDGKSAVANFFFGTLNDQRTFSCAGTCAAPSDDNHPTNPDAIPLDGTRTGWWVLCGSAVICFALGFIGGRQR